MPRSIDPQFVDAAANRLMVAGITRRKSIDSCLDPDPGAQVSQTVEPVVENIGGTDTRHGLFVTYGGQSFNPASTFTKPRFGKILKPAEYRRHATRGTRAVRG
jgi:hypothetical protein